MKTILVVDDEYALVETLTDLLQDEGYQVISASNGEAALARLQNEKPDMILTDFMMPILDGVEFTKRLRALPAFQDTPVVMMSAVNKAIAMASHPKGLKLSGYLNKPFQLDALLSLVERLIGKGTRQRG